MTPWSPTAPFRKSGRTPLHTPSTDPASPEVIRLDHGWDESKPLEALTLEDLRQAVSFRGGECLAETYSDPYAPIRWRSARGNEFGMCANLVLLGGHWCPQELPWPWDYDTEAKLNPFFAQVWYPLHDSNEHNVYDSEIYRDFPEHV